MEINSQNYSMNFKAKLSIRGFTKNMCAEELCELKKVAELIGDGEKDMVDVFVHPPKGDKSHTIIDFAGYVENCLRAFNSFYSGNNPYEGIMDGLVYSVNKIYSKQARETALSYGPEKADLLVSLIEKFNTKKSG